MKIHGTAKGGALSQKDFGVAFGGNGAVAELLWEQTSTGESDGMQSGEVIIAGQRFLAEQVLIGATPTKIIFNLKKTGSASGTAELKLINSSDVEKASFGTIDMDDLDGTFAEKTFENASNTETVAAGDRIVFYYSGAAYFYIELCTLCTGSATKSTHYIAPNWTDRENRLCTMKVYGTAA